MTDPDAGEGDGGHERIGPTAHYTAYVWHRLGLPHAEHFKTGTGRLLYWGFFALGEWTTRLLPAVPSMRDYLEYRHVMIDAVTIAEEPDLLVEIGSGLTRRAVTFAADHGVRAVELDLPGMAAIKRRRLAALPADLRARLDGRHTVEGANVLAEDFADVLAGVLAGARRPVVVAEGLMSYFDDAGRARLLASVADALRRGGGGLFVCDTHTKVAQAEVGTATRVLKTTIAVLTRRPRALGGYKDDADLHESFARAGFSAVAYADPTALAPTVAGHRSPAKIVTARVSSR